MSFSLGVVLTITGTENLKLLKDEFKLVLSIFDRSVMLPGKIGNDDFLFEPIIGI